MNPEPAPDPSLEPGDAVDDLMVECLRHSLATRQSALTGLCVRHPDLAAALRRRYAFLLEAGLIEGPNALAAALPERIGGFRILRRLGQGGMGVVYLAEQESLGRRVALKVIQPGAAAPPRARERFRREVQAVSLLDHPNICQVHDAGEVEGVPYLAMRYVEGETLAERIARETAAGGNATPAGDSGAIDALVAIGEQLARALHAAHEKGLVHRDVKPGNVMIEATTGQPLLLDFGLARLDDDETPTLTLSGDRLGTPAYMSPEQVAGLTVDRRTDVYALGATLYEALTGHVPHQAPTREALYRRILTAEISLASRHNPRISRELEIVLATALDRDADRRYRTAAEFADDLRRVLRREPILAQPPGVGLRARRWCQRNPYAASALTVLAAGLLTTVVLLGRLDREVRKTSVVLQTRQALDLRTTNPGQALRLSLASVQDEDRPSPQTVAALRAALHAPQIEAIVDVDEPFGLAFDATPDGSVLAWLSLRSDATDEDRTSFERHLWVHAAGQTRQLGTLPGKHSVFCLRLSPDGRRIAVAGNDAPAFVFALDGKVLELRTPEPVDRSERVFSVAWHPSGNLLAVGTGDHNLSDTGAWVHLWDLDAENLEKPLWSQPVGATPWHLQFVDDDHLVVAPGCGAWASHPGFKNHHVRLFHRDGTLVRWHEEHKQPCQDMAVSGALVATVGHDQQLVLWNCLADGNPVVRKHGGRIQTVDFARDGQTVVTACEDGKVRVFDRLGNPLFEWAAHGQVESAVFHPDGRQVLVRLRDRRLMFTIDGRRLAQLPSARAGGCTDRFLPDGRLLTFDRDAIRRWRLAPDGLATTFLGKSEKPVFSPDGSLMLVMGFDGAADLRDRQGKRIWQAKVPLPGAPSLKAWVCLDNEGRAYAATDDRHLVVVSPPDGAVSKLEHVNDVQTWFRPIWYLGCASEGGLVAGSAAGENLRIAGRNASGAWEVLRGFRQQRSDGLLLQPRRPFLWCHGPDGGWRILAGTQRGVVEFTFAQGEIKLGPEFLFDFQVDQIALSPDEQTLAVDLADAGTQIWVCDGWSWKQHAAVPLQVPVVDLAFARNDRLLVTSTESVMICDLDLQVVGMLPNLDEVGFVWAHCLPGGDKVVTVAGNQVMREWWVGDARVMAAAQHLLARQPEGAGK